MISATCTQGTQDGLGNMNGLRFGMRAETSTSIFKDSKELHSLWVVYYETTWKMAQVSTERKLSSCGSRPWTLCMPDGLFAGACNRCGRSNAPTSLNNYQPMTHLTSSEEGVSAVHEFDSSIHLQASSAWVLRGWLQYLSKGRLVSGSVAYLGSAGLKCLTIAGSQNACILSPS